MNHWIVIAAVSGFIAVLMGAFAAHGLRPAAVLPTQGWIETGARYQMWHTLALLAIGLLEARHAAETAGRWLPIAGWAFLIGIILFSGSLYLLALTNLRLFALITPVGGLVFLVGWFALAAYGAGRRER